MQILINILIFAVTITMVFGGQLFTPSTVPLNQNQNNHNYQSQNQNNQNQIRYSFGHAVDPRPSSGAYSSTVQHHTNSAGPLSQSYGSSPGSYDSNNNNNLGNTGPNNGGVVGLVGVYPNLPIRNINNDRGLTYHPFHHNLHYSGNQNRNQNSAGQAGFGYEYVSY